MNELQTELGHMLRLLRSPTMGQAWKAYMKAKALELADEHPPTYGELPRLLAAEMRAGISPAP